MRGSWPPLTADGKVLIANGAGDAGTRGWVAALDGQLVARSIAGALVAGGALLIVHLGRGVGLGDVKMAAVVGAAAGMVAFAAAPIAIVVAAVSASAYGALARRPSLALGPALWFGWAIAVASASAGWWS